MNYKLTGWMLLLMITVAGCSTQQTDVTKSEPLKPNSVPNAETRFAAGQLAESQGEVAKAIEQYEEASKLAPNLPLPLLRLGVLYTGQRDFEKAIDAWNRYIKVTNNSAAGYCNLGFTQELAQRKPDAEESYKSAIRIEPTNETARVNYGLMLARQGRFEEARAQLQVVLTPAEVHYNIASVLQSQGKTADARAEYKVALTLDPDMSDAKTRLADLN